MAGSPVTQAKSSGCLTSAVTRGSGVTNIHLVTHLEVDLRHLPTQATPDSQKHNLHMLAHGHVYPLPPIEPATVPQTQSKPRLTEETSLHRKTGADSDAGALFHTNSLPQDPQEPGWTPLRWGRGLLSGLQWPLRNPLPRLWPTPFSQEEVFLLKISAATESFFFFF